MSLKKAGTSIATTGLLAILLNPMILAIVVIAALIIAAVGLGFIIYYGLFSALLLFFITAIPILFLGYTHIVDLNKNRFLIVLPWIMFGLGYVGQRFSTVPLSISTPPNTTVTVLLTVLVLVFAIAASKKE